MKILITNAYSGENKGDAGIIKGMIESLSARPSFKDAEFIISTADYPSDSQRYSHRVVPSFHSIQSTFATNPYFRSLSFLGIIFPLSLVWLFFYRFLQIDIRIPREIRSLMHIYRDSDLIIAAGGGYLYSTSRIFGNIVILKTIYSFLPGVFLGKPVYLFSQSIGPFAGWFQSWLVKRALSKVRLIEVREEYSFTLANSWNIKAPIHRTVDAAFLLPSDDSFSIPDMKGEKLRVGMTVRKWFRNENSQQQYEKTIGNFINWLTDDLDALVFFIPQVTFETGNDDDRTAAVDICSHIKLQNSIFLIKEKLSPEQIKGLCGKMDYFVGTRMHSNIYALSMNVPTLAIEYQPKTAGIMRQVGMENFVLPITNLNATELRDKFKNLIRHQNEIRECLREKIPEIRKSAAYSSQLIERDYNSSIHEANHSL